MVNLALSYEELGRHEDALVLLERVLEFFRRVLPEDHLCIGGSRVRTACPCMTTCSLVE